jgi:hypothetical protein
MRYVEPFCQSGRNIVDGRPVVFRIPRTCINELQIRGEICYILRAAVEQWRFSRV